MIATVYCKTYKSGIKANINLAKLLLTSSSYYEDVVFINLDNNKFPINGNYPCLYILNPLSVDINTRFKEIASFVTSNNFRKITIVCSNLSKEDLYELTSHLYAAFSRVQFAYYNSIDYNTTLSDIVMKDACKSAIKSKERYEKRNAKKRNKRNGK